MCGPLAIPLAATAIGAVAARGAVRYVGRKLKGDAPAPLPPAADPLPAENIDASAEQTAQFNRRRTLRALSGSNTNLTRGLAAPVTGAPKTLLGS